MFQPLAEDEPHSENDIVDTRAVVESHVKIILTKRQRIRNRATAAARARKAIQIPLRRDNRMRLRDLVHIEMMSHPIELRKLQAPYLSALVPGRDSYCSEAATAADTNTPILHRTSTHVGIRVRRQLK